MQPGVRPAGSDPAASPGRVRSARSGSEPPGRHALAGRYLLDELLHRSPYAEVWRVADPEGRHFALKLVRDDGSPRYPAMLATLERELDALRRVRHPNIVTVIERIGDGHGPGRIDGIVLEYLPGGDLVSLAGSPVRCWAQPVAGLIDAVSAVHEQGLVHRDVKARNVMLDAGDQPRLIDFGSCRSAGAAWTDAGTSSAHRPPEPEASPAVKRIVTGRDDVYALAVLIEEMVTGSVSYAARGVEAPTDAVSAPEGSGGAIADPIVDLLRLARETIAAYPRLPVNRLAELAAAVQAAHEAEVLAR